MNISNDYLLKNTQKATKLMSLVKLLTQDWHIKMNSFYIPKQ